jgi:hypothetical protein
MFSWSETVGAVGSEDARCGVFALKVNAISSHIPIALRRADSLAGNQRTGSGECNRRRKVGGGNQKNE